jgi:hypothetical protein
MGDGPEDYYGFEPEHERVMKRIDAEGLNPALKRMSQGSLGAIISVYNFLDLWNRGATKRRKLEQAIGKVERAQSLCPDTPELEAARARLKSTLEWSIYTQKCAWAVPLQDAPLGATKLGQYSKAELSPFEVLVGVLLPKVYRRCCGEEVRRPTRNSYTGGYTGEYFAFARIVLDECDILDNGRPYSDGAIDGALSRVRRLYPDEARQLYGQT